MSETEETPRQDLLAAFRLGPSWAREPGKKLELPDRGEEPERGVGRHGGGHGGRGERRDSWREGGGGGRDHRGQSRDGGWGGRGGDRGREGRGERGRDGRGGGRGWRGDDRPPPVEPARGVRIEVQPSPEAVALIAREIQQVARVYSLFEIAEVLLADRSRYVLRFRVTDRATPLWRSRRDDSLWLTKDEALAHFRSAPWFAELYEQEEIEVSPPRGNFQAVARCGLSGEWLGPPNYHGYQTNLRRLHRERFSHLPFERYVANVRTERGEEALNAWLATMTKHTRWRPVGGGDEDWMTDRAEVERHFARTLFEQVFEAVTECELPGNVAARVLSPGLLETLKLATAHARRHPAMIIPPACQLLEKSHVAVFKRQGRLFSGPARPHPLAPDIVLAERPATILSWLARRGEAKLAELWKDLLPDGQQDPCERWLADLLWLLNGGHVLLFADDTLVLPRRREDSPPAARERDAAPKPGRDGKAKGKPREQPAARAAAAVPDKPAKAMKAAATVASPSGLLAVPKRLPKLARETSLVRWGRKRPAVSAADTRRFSAAGRLRPPKQARRAAKVWRQRMLLGKRRHAAG